jgi:mRNA interferase MazF
MIRRGQIYFVDLNPVLGQEQAGQRPVLVVSIDAINRQPLVVTVISGTDGGNIAKDYPTNLRLTAAETGLPRDTVFLAFQIRSLDAARFGKAPAGAVSAQRLPDLDKALRFVLGL